MNEHTRFRTPRAAVFALSLAALFCLSTLAEARAASWKGIEPLKSKRADVERALGTPVRDSPSEATLQFDVMGGRVTVFFVTPKFIAAKKLPASLEGTVLQIVLQHERATDTPESLGVDKNKSFERDAKGDVAVYANAKDGIFYTFIGGTLRTTRYAPPADQLAKNYNRKS